MPQCSKCGKNFVRRSHRRGVIERLLSVGYVYPFRCQLCSHRFKALQWGVRYSKHVVDRREYERIPTGFSVTFQGDHVRGEGVATDISMAGCALETDARLAVEALLQLRLQIPDRDPAVTVDAAVVRSVRARAVGLQFLRLQPQDRDHLHHFVQGLLGTRPS